MSKLHTQPGLTISVKAGAALTANRFALVTSDLSGVAVAEPSSAGGFTVGVSPTAAALGALTNLVTSGVVVVEASDAISHGVGVEVATGGKAVTLSAGKKVGIALTSAGADGDLMTVLLTP